MASKIDRQERMKREVELRRLLLDDKSAIVLTNVRVFHHRDKGFFGEEKASIRHEAIASLQIGWRRSEGLLLAGIILLGIWLFLWAGSVVIAPAELAPDAQAADAAAEGGFSSDQIVQLIGRLFSSTLASIIKYASLLSGLCLFVVFWFYKPSEILIAGSGATIRGNPASYQDGCKFCDLVLAVLEDLPIATQPEPPPAEKKEKQPEKKNQADKEWRLS